MRTLPAKIAIPTPIAELNTPKEMHDDEYTLRNCTEELSDKEIKMPAPDVDDEYPEELACTIERSKLLTFDCKNASI
jgi:hypothetical protein